MAAKPEAKEAAPAPAAEKAPAPPAAGGGLKAFLPPLLAIILTPAVCWAVAEFVLLPRMQAKLGAAAAAPATPAHDEAEAEPAAEEEGGHGGGHGKKEGAADNYEFTNVVVNLAGTMGTRYLKTSFIVTGAKPGTIKPLFETNKAKLTDITLNVLSSLSLADLEEPGSKNVLREKLVTAYNQALGKRIADQVYFSDFVIQ